MREQGYKQTMYTVLLQIEYIFILDKQDSFLKNLRNPASNVIFLCWLFGLEILLWEC